MELEEIKIREKRIYEGRIIHLRSDTVRLPNGKEAQREVVEHSGGVCIAPLTEKNELIFVRQFRYPYEKVLLELPAGKLERGEDPLEAGKREMMEETGYTADKFLSLGSMYPTPGYVNEVIYLYLAEELHCVDAHPDEDEFLAVEKIFFEDAVDMVMQDTLHDAKTALLILKIAQLKRGYGK